MLEKMKDEVELISRHIEVARAVVVRADRDFSTLYVDSGTKPFDVGSEARRGVPAR